MSRPTSLLVAAAVLLAGCGTGVTATNDASGTSSSLEPLATIRPTTVAPTTTEPARDPLDVEHIVMIGDSITVSSTQQLEVAFADAGFDDVLIVAQENKRIGRQIRSNPSGVAVASFLTDEPADRSDELWVLALGTNDITQYDDDELRAVIDELLDAVPAESPVVWVDTFWRSQPEATQQVNSMIAERLATREPAAVARWSAVADRDGLLTGDGVHLRPDGSVQFARTVVDAVVNLVDG